MCSNRFLFLFAVLFNLCLGQMEKSSLTFVIDDTGSMGDDIDQVKQGVNLVFDTVMNSNSSQIEDFVLVTFNDPAFKFRTCTKSREEFKRELAKIYVDLGGDCPEMAMQGIKLALQRSRPGSYLYVFTDASAKDVDQLDEVKSMAIKKNCQIVFLLTGRCTLDDNDPQYQAYYQLAKATSGQVFHMKKQEIGQILKYVADSIKNRKTLITSKVLPPGYGHNISLPVDGDMKTLVIAESGKDPKIDVTAPDGSTPNSTKVVDLPNVLTLRIDDTEPGVYTAVVGSKSETSVVVTASTTIQFKHGFSGAKATAIGDTATRPVAGEKTYLSIQLITPDNDKFLDVVEIMDIEEKVIKKLPLTMVNEMEKFYSTIDFEPPNFTFKIAIRGIDKKTDTEFRRISLTPIEVQRPRKAILVDPISATVRIANGIKIDAEYDKQLRISCKVSGYPKPDVVWSDTASRTLTAPLATVELPYDYISVLEIDRVTNNATYTCTASNIYGTNSQNVYVETMRKEYFNVKEVPKDTPIEYLKSGSVTCKVDALPPAEIKWLINGTELYSDDYIDISADKSVLTVKDMRAHLNRRFVCEASNGRDNKTFPFKIRITGFEKPKIEELPPVHHGERGNYTEINCRIVAGSPKPTVTWFFRPEDSRSFSKLDETDEILRINDLDFHHAGGYTCYVSNDAGQEFSETTLIIDYSPTIDRDSVYVKSKHGERTTLKCVVHGEPKPKVKWFRNGEEIFNDRGYHIYRDHSLRFRGSVENSGKYSCVASNTYGTARRSIQVDYVVPVAIDAPEVSTWEMKMGDRISLPCHADGYPRPSIKWVFFNSETKVPRVMMPSGYDSGTLNMLSLQPHQDGYYTCVASNVVSSSNITYQIKVLAPPFIRKDTKSAYSAVIHDLVVPIPCQAKGNPKPNITWTKNGLNIAAGTEWYDIDSNNTLIIKNIDEKSAGNYVCHASNKVGTDSKIYSVKVKPYPDTRSVPTVTLNVELGSTIELPCDAPHTRLDYVRWFKDRRLISEGVANLTDVKFTDAGVYICYVSTFAKSTASVVEVVVGYKPDFISDTQLKINYEEGVPAFLDCEADGEPDPEVTWAFNGKTMDFTKMLMDFEMSAKTAGTYTCLVKNRFGRINRTIEIISLDCMLNLREDFTKNQPLMVESPHNIRLPLFDNNNGFIRVPSKETVILYCPSGFSNFPKTEVMARCEGQTNFEIEEGNIYKYSELKCNEEVKPQMQRTGRQCRSADTESVKIGYALQGQFLEVYEVCLDKRRNSPVYTKTILHRSLADVNPRDEPKWLDDELGLQLNEIYDCGRQIENISSHLGKWFNVSDNCCFNNRKLTNPRDLLGGVSQKAAYSFLNTVPQWSTCGSKNWDLLEQKVRDLAQPNDLLVWTGLSGQLKLPNADAVPVNITLSDTRGHQQVVPQYLWKVVQMPETQSSVAIVQLNIPRVTLLEALGHIYCQDVCRDIPWLDGVHWKDPAAGFTYCCTLEEFERAFGYGGHFGDNMNVLYGYSLLSESTA